MTCPFLTTYEEKIECFEECAFYDNDDGNKECPFTKIDLNRFELYYNQKYDYNKNTHYSRINN